MSEFSLFSSLDIAVEYQDVSAQEPITSPTADLRLEFQDAEVELHSPSIIEPYASTFKLVDPSSEDGSSPGMIGESSASPSEFRTSHPLPLLVAKPQNCAQRFASTEYSSNSPSAALQTLQIPSEFHGRKRTNQEFLVSGQLDLNKHTKARETPRRKRKRADQGEPLPGRFCFDINSDAPAIQERTKYSNSRRKEIEEIRDIRACFSCRLLKKRVSLSSNVDL